MPRLLDLREPVLGPPHGAGLARLGDGEVVGGVQRAPVVAGAGGLTAAFLHLGQAGGQERASRSPLLEAAVEHPTDQRGVARHRHRWALGLPVSGAYTGKGPKNQSAKKKPMAQDGWALQQRFYLGRAPTSRCDESPISQSWGRFMEERSGPDSTRHCLQNAFSSIINVASRARWWDSQETTHGTPV